MEFQLVLNMEHAHLVSCLYLSFVYATPGIMELIANGLFLSVFINSMELFAVTMEFV